MNENSCARSSALPMFLAGLGTGVAMALLLAPLSGDATRGLITRKVNDGRAWVKDRADGAEDYVRTQGADLRGRVNDVAEAITRA